MLPPGHESGWNVAYASQRECPIHIDHRQGPDAAARAIEVHTQADAGAVSGSANRQAGADGVLTKIFIILDFFCFL